MLLQLAAALIWFHLLRNIVKVFQEKTVLDIISRAITIFIYLLASFAMWRIVF